MHEGISIPVSSPSITDLELDNVAEALKSQWISSMSPYVKGFEDGFSKYVGVRHGVATNSGTTALHLALAALGVGEGNEVIIPTFTMIATANVVEYQRAIIKLVDADPHTWNIDTDAIEDQITDKTKVIMPVDIYGYPSDFDKIRKISDKYGLTVIEDAAEAHGAVYKGRKAGSLGDIGCFSFYANKIITTGEGGMAVTDNKELAEKMAWLRAHAFGRGGKHFWHEELGYGYRMSGLQGALGVAQLKRLENFVDKRIANAKLYNDLLSRAGDQVTLPPESKDVKNVYWMYSILLKSKASRDGMMKFLKSKGVETRTFFYPIHHQPYYASRYSNMTFPVSDSLSDRGVNLPSGNQLTEDEIRYVCENILEYLKGEKS